MMSCSASLWSENAQHAVLGSVLLDNGLMHAINLPEDDFFGPDRTLFRLMLQKWGEGEPFDAATIATSLNGQLQNVGGPGYLGHLVDGAVPDSGLVKSHAKTIRKFSRLRKLALLGDQLTKGAWELTVDPECLVSAAERVVAELRAEYEAEQSERPDGLICLADVGPQPVDWLWSNRIPHGTVTMIDGDPGLGKSTMTLDLAARVTVGAPMPLEERTGVPAGVIVLSSEDLLAQTIRPRLDASGADNGRVFAFDPSTDIAPLTFPEDISRLEAMIATRGVKLVIVDPLVAFLGEDINSHKDQDVRRALAPLQRMAERTNVAVIGIRHLNKSAGGNALYRGGGSIAIIGAARAGFLVALDPDDPQIRILAPTKANLAPPMPSLQFQVVNREGSDIPKIAWRGASERSASELVGQSVSDEEKSAALEDAVDFLHEILWDGDMPAKEVQLEAKRRGLSWRTIKRAKRKAGVESQKSDFKGQWIMTMRRGPRGPEGDQPKTVAPFENFGPLGRHPTDDQEDEKAAWGGPS